MSISINELRMICDSYTPVKSGRMLLDGKRYSEDDTQLSVIYDTNLLPYIWYQEKGFKHWITKKKIIKNQFFIANRTANGITQLVSAGGNERSILNAQNKITVQSKAQQVSQGLLEELKGNANR